MSASKIIALAVWMLAASSFDSARASSPRPSSSASYDLWIRNGTVVDGTGRAGFKADVLVIGDRVAFVGSVGDTRIKTQRVIDAAGKVVTPGFIDTHAHGDPSLDASMSNFLRQGVTTIVLGQDGQTAGFEERPLPTLSARHSSNNTLKEDIEHPVNLAQWMKLVERRASEVNIAAFVGHGTLRLLAGVDNESRPTAPQMALMQEILRRDLAAGAFGLSLGLEYVPGRYAELAELQALSEVVGQHRGIVMSHMRSEDDDKIKGAIDELLALGAHARVHVSHIKVVFGRNAEQAQAVLQQLSDARARGLQVSADVYPYLASFGNMTLIYPDWAKRRSQFDLAVQERRPQLEAYLRERVIRRNGPQAVLFASGQYAGKTLEQLAQSLHKPYEKVLIDDLGYPGADAAHFIMAQQVQDLFITDDRIAICTDGGPAVPHPRSAGAFAKILEDYVGAKPKMSMERAIHKMTGLPADILGIDRGVLATGRKADILVLSPTEVHVRATWTEPMLPSSGYEFVIVNGKVAFEHDTTSVQKHGRVVKRMPQN